jgi:hypothetical protein
VLVKPQTRAVVPGALVCHQRTGESPSAGVVTQIEGYEEEYLVLASRQDYVEDHVRVHSDTILVVYEEVEVEDSLLIAVIVNPGARIP